MKIKALALSLLAVTSSMSLAADADLKEMHAIFNTCVGADGAIQCLNNQGKKDYRRLERMTALMKNALMDNPDDPIVRNNVLGLYQQAYNTLKSHQLTPEWRLPGDIREMNITVRRTFNDEEQFSIVVRGMAQQAKVIKQFRIAHYPDHILIDKTAGVGQWEEYQNENRFGIESKRSSQKIETGLYTLDIELENGTKTQGWFLVDDDMNASTSPTVQSPVQGQIFNTGNPTFNWTNFISAEYKPYERRWFWSGVARVEPPQYNWDDKWQLFQENPTIHQATPGVDGRFISAKDSKLAAGNYLVTFNYKELKSFGDIEVGRGAITERSFKVKP